MKPTTSIHLDTRRPKSNGKYPLKLRVTHLRQRKYYNIDIDLTDTEWQKVNSPKPRNELKDIKDKATDKLKKADEVIDKLEAFSFSAFERMYFRTTAKSLDLVKAFQTYYESLTCQKRINTAESYDNAITSLTAFKKNLLMTDITPEFLNKYEEWMLQKDRSLTTIGIYLRSLRAILNSAIEEGILKREYYPFGKRKYRIPAGQNIKKALSMDDITSLYYCNAVNGSPKDKARDFWMFSYLANGMNFKDICRLKFANLHKETIVFYRSKTERTKRSNPVPIVVIITDDIKRIIDKWGNANKNQTDYVFPILSDEMAAQTERKTIKQFIKTTNKYLKKIVKETGIAAEVTTYAARHSFSTIMKNGGAPIEYIKESLGHNSTQTTESYLNIYPDSMKKQFIEQLTTFKRTAQSHLKAV